MQRIRTLDGWRGIAILLVLLAHFGTIATVGMHGVTLFFVLSGFLITRLLLQEQDSSGSIGLRAFYVRRAFRLLPCSLCFLTCVALLQHAVSITLVTRQEMLGSLFFFRNYLDTAGLHGITAHFWSLSVEEQFYLLWPTALILLKRRPARWAAIAGTLCLAAYRAATWQHWTILNGDASHGSGLHFDALLIGSLAALEQQRITAWLRDWHVVPLLSALAFGFAHYFRLIPTWESCAMALLLLQVAANRTPLSAVLSWSPLVWLGRASYSIYIWQQPFSLTDPNQMHPIRAICAMLVGFASFFLIERPGIEWGRRLQETKVYAAPPVPDAAEDTVIEKLCDPVEPLPSVTVTVKLAD